MKKYDLDESGQSQRPIKEILKEISELKKHLRAKGGRSRSGVPERRLETVQRELVHRRQKRLETDYLHGREQQELETTSLPPGTIDVNESDTVDLATYR